MLRILSDAYDETMLLTPSIDSHEEKKKKKKKATFQGRTNVGEGVSIFDLFDLFLSLFLSPPPPSHVARVGFSLTSSG